MPLPDADPEKWVYHEHTKAKHEVLRKYLVPWVNKLTEYNEQAFQFNKIRIVDCFAGRGDYYRTEGTTSVELEHIDSSTDIPGSPQIILDRVTGRDAEFVEAECIFIESDEDNYDTLLENLSSLNNVPEKVNYEAIYGKFEETILDLVDTDGSDCPTFCFIDPFGFASLEYDVITELGGTPQFEFLITFMSRDMNRFLDSEDHQAALTRVFGTEDWREEVEEYDAENWEPLVEYYSQRLVENGPESTFEYLITKADTRQTVYYLVFGTNHSEGMHTMREVMSHCGTGQFAYAPKHPQYTREQSQLIGGIEQTKSFLLDRFAGFRIPFNDLVRTCSEEESYRNETEPDYREALHELEDEGKIDVTRVTSSQDGIQGNDLMDFPDQDP